MRHSRHFVSSWDSILRLQRMAMTAKQRWLSWNSKVWNQSDNSDVKTTAKTILLGENELGLDWWNDQSLETEIWNFTFVSSKKLCPKTFELKKDFVQTEAFTSKIQFFENCSLPPFAYENNIFTTNRIFETKSSCNSCRLLESWGQNTSLLTSHHWNPIIFLTTCSWFRDAHCLKTKMIAF